MNQFLAPAVLAAVLRISSSPLYSVLMADACHLWLSDADRFAAPASGRMGAEHARKDGGHANE